MIYGRRGDEGRGILGCVVDGCSLRYRFIVLSINAVRCTGFSWRTENGELVHVLVWLLGAGYFLPIMHLSQAHG